MRKRSLFAGIMAAVLSLTATGLAACGDKTEDGPQTPPEEEGEVMPTFDYKTYDNVEFSNYLDGAETDSIITVWATRSLCALTEHIISIPLRAVRLRA